MSRKVVNCTFKWKYCKKIDQEPPLTVLFDDAPSVVIYVEALILNSRIEINENINQEQKIYKIPEYNIVFLTIDFISKGHIKWSGDAGDEKYQ